MRKSSRPGFFNVPTCAAKKKSTVVVGVVLQYGHYEDKAFKIFKLQYSVPTGMEELHKKLVDHGFNKKDWESSQFVRLRTLKARLDRLEKAGKSS